MLEIVRPSLLALLMMFIVPSSALGSEVLPEHQAHRMEPVQFHFEAWSRATPGAVRTAAVFGTLTNGSQHAVSIHPVGADIAERIMVHDTVLEDGMMRMRHQSALHLDAGESLILKPGGLHLMLTGLHASVKKDEQFEVTLAISTSKHSDHEESGRIEEMVTLVRVLEVGSMGPGAAVTTGDLKGADGRSSRIDHQQHH